MGEPVKPQTKYQAEILNRYNDITIARELKITIEEVHKLPTYYYQDIILILNKEAAIRTAKQKAADKKKTRR